MSTPQGTVFLDGPDAFGEATVDGTVWKWEYHEYLGPFWLRKDGDTPRKCQCPTSKKVWAAFEAWLNNYEKRKSKWKKQKRPTTHR